MVFRRVQYLFWVNPSTILLLIFLTRRKLYIRYRSVFIMLHWFAAAIFTPFLERQLHIVRPMIALMDFYSPAEWLANVVARIPMNCAFTLEPRIKALQLLIASEPTIYGYFFTGGGRFATPVQQVRDMSLQLAAFAVPLLLNSWFYGSALRSLRRALAVQYRQDTAELLVSSQKHGAASGPALPVSPYPRVQ